MSTEHTVGFGWTAEALAEDLGPRELRNIPGTVRVWRIKLATEHPDPGAAPGFALPARGDRRARRWAWPCR